MTLLDDAPGQGTDTAPPAPAFDLSAFTAVSQGRPSPLAHVKEPDGGFWRKGPSGPPLVSCPEGTITKSGGRKGEVRLVQYGSAANFVQLILDTHDAEAQECREVVFGLGSNPRLMRDAVTFAARKDIDERSGKNDGNILVSAIRKHARESMAMLPEDAMYNEMRLATMERRDWLLRTLAAIAEGAITEQDSELYQRFGLDVAEPAPSVVYDRSSGFAGGIAEHHAVHLWDHRKIMQGIALSAELADRTRALGADPRIGEPLWNAEADSIAAKARRVAKSDRASSQGTHAHALTEMADLERDWIQMAKEGEDLGVPVSVAESLVAAWDEMCAKFGLLQMQVEARVVNDKYRVAGSADRFTLCTRELRFPMHDGTERVIPAGTVLIGDLKTGSMKLDRRGYASYWSHYACQLALYQGSVMYSPDTGERGEWPWPVSDEHALLFHLDVLGALEGRPSCVPYYVDLKIGREAADLVVAAKEFAERTDVISLAPISGWTDSPVLSGGMSATLFDSTTVAPELEREQVRARLNALRVNHPDSMRALAACWPAGVPSKFDGHLHTVAELAAIDVVLAPLEQAAAASVVLDGPGRAKAKAGWLAEIQSTVAASPAPVPVAAAVEVPVSGVAFDAFLPDEGGQVDPASFDTLVDRYKALPDTARVWMGQFILAAAEAGVSFRPREFGMAEGTWVSTVRRFEIMRGLVLTAESELAAARQRGDSDPFDQSLTDVVGMCVASACDAVMPVSVGAALGALTGEQAKVFAVCAAGLADGTASVSFPHGADSPRVTPTAV